MRANTSLIHDHESAVEHVEAPFLQEQDGQTLLDGDRLDRW
jgi:hypothetical protein